MGVELTLGTVMVVAMLSTLLTKYLSTVLLVRRRERLHRIEAELRDLQGRLKAVENEKAVAERNAKAFTSQQERLKKRIPKLQQQLKTMEK